MTGVQTCALPILVPTIRSRLPLILSFTDVCDPRINSPDSKSSGDSITDGGDTRESSKALVNGSPDATDVKGKEEPESSEANIFISTLFNLGRLKEGNTRIRP